MGRKPRKRAWILIVEDEGLIALDIETILKDAGYRVLASTATGAGAFAAAARRVPDLAVVDIALRGGIDGIETARRLQARHGVRIVFVSANTDSATMTRVRALKPAGFVRKPFDARQLQQAVAAALAGG